MARWAIAGFEVPGTFRIRGRMCSCAPVVTSWDGAGAISPRIQTPTVHQGGNARRQAVRLKRFFDAPGPKITLICILDPGVHEESEVDTDADGLGDNWEENDGLG